MDNSLFFPLLILVWLVVGYFPGGVLAAVLCWIFKKKNMMMPCFRLWEWGVPFAAMAVNLTFLILDLGFFGKSLANICEGQITGWSWCIFFVLRTALPWRRSAMAGGTAAFLTLLSAVLLGLFMPCLPE